MPSIPSRKPGGRFRTQLTICYFRRHGEAGGPVAQLGERSPRRQVAGPSTFMYFVYILRSLKNKRFYTGSTDNVERRFAEHNSGRSKATRHVRPFELLHVERYSTRTEAVRRERLLKTGKGRNELKK